MNKRDYTNFGGLCYLVGSCSICIQTLSGASVRCKSKLAAALCGLSLCRHLCTVWSFVVTNPIDSGGEDTRFHRNILGDCLGDDVFLPVSPYIEGYGFYDLFASTYMPTLTYGMNILPTAMLTASLFLLS